jgi:hypothetical protein
MKNIRSECETTLPRQGHGKRHGKSIVDRGFTSGKDCVNRRSAKTARGSATRKEERGEELAEKTTHHPREVDSEADSASRDQWKL